MDKDPFKQYIKESEPTKRDKGYAWHTAIGLQAVDGLKPSEYLVKTAVRNIEGEITFEEANELLLNENNPLHNRALHISGAFVEPEKVNIDAEKANIGKEKVNIEANEKFRIAVRDGGTRDHRTGLRTRKRKVSLPAAGLRRWEYCRIKMARSFIPPRLNFSQKQSILGEKQEIWEKGISKCEYLIIQN